MEIVYDETQLRHYMQYAVQASEDCPVLLDRFLDNATEVDVDAIADGSDVLIGGIMEHIEQAGVHSGDSACSLPPFSLDAATLAELAHQTRLLAQELGVIGLMNIQFAIQDGDIYVLEVNPRASRTVPFVSKATGIPLAKVAARCMVGSTLAAQGVRPAAATGYFAVKEAVFPFIKFPGVDPLLGPEMRSTGEVMGLGRNFGEAFAKAQLGAGVILPTHGCALLSVRDADKPHIATVGRDLIALGFSLCATEGTARVLWQAGLACERALKVTEGRPNIVDMIKNGQIQLIVNTTEGRQAITDSFEIRRTLLQYKVCYTTTFAGAKAITQALAALPVRAVVPLHTVLERQE
jgi:carbamoyl-phosphate synthase large subunit